MGGGGGEALCALCAPQGCDEPKKPGLDRVKTPEHAMCSIVLRMNINGIYIFPK